MRLKARRLFCQHPCGIPLHGCFFIGTKAYAVLQRYIPAPCAETLCFKNRERPSAFLEADGPSGILALREQDIVYRQSLSMPSSCVAVKKTSFPLLLSKIKSFSGLLV